MNRVGYYQRVETIYGDMLIVVIHPSSMSRETAHHYVAHYVTLPEGADGELSRTQIRSAPATVVDGLLRAVRNAKKALGI